MSGGRQVAILDLTTAQVRRIEAAMGVPVDDWKGVSKGTLFPAILAEVDGVDPSFFDDVPLRELVERITIEDTEGNAESEPS